MFLVFAAISLLAGATVATAGGAATAVSITALLCLGVTAWRSPARFLGAPSSRAPTGVARLGKSVAIFAVALIGAVLGIYANRPPQLATAITDAISSERRASIEARVMAPQDAAGPDKGSRFRADLVSIDSKVARASLAVSVASGVADVLPGDTVRFAARLREVRGLVNPGLPDTSLPARIAGVELFAGVGPKEAIVRIHPQKSAIPVLSRLTAWWLRLAGRARRALAVAIDAGVQGEAGAFLHTTILGERRGVSEKIEAGFRAAGATHVLSVSGLHLAAVAVVAFAVLRKLLTAIPKLPLWVDPKRLAAAVALPGIAFYTALTGAAVATVRSALMAGVAFVGIMLGRSSTAIVSVAFAVIVLVVGTPLVVLDVSFRLSVASVAALAVLVPMWTDRGRDGGDDGSPVWARARVLRWIPERARLWAVRFGAATVAATAATAPLVAHHFGEVAVASPVGNLLLVPLVEMVVVPFGLAGATLSAAMGLAWGWPLLKIAEMATRGALAVAEGFRTVAPVWLTRAPNVLETTAFTLGGALLVAALPPSATRRRPKAIVAAVAVAVALTSIGTREVLRRTSRDLLVTFLDVGQGDAALVELPGGHTMLIDGGGTFDGSFDPGARVVEPFLRARGITRLDAVALSHPHPDHMNGLFRIFERFDVGTLWTSGDDGQNPEYRRLIDLAKARGVRTPRPTTWHVGGAALDPLGPFTGDERSEWIGAAAGLTVNDASLVIRAAYGPRSFLFTGDLEADGEGELRGRVDRGQRVASDVLKVPHHGSRTSSSDELLDVVRPQLAVMSLGWRNRFHFPRPEVIDRYRRRGIRVLRTDLDGAITVRVRPDGTMEATCARVGR